MFAAVSLPGVDVLDVEQVVVRGHLTLAVLVSAGAQEGETIAAAHAAGAALGLHVTCVAGRGDNAPRRPGRLHVTVLASSLRPVAVAAIADRLAQRGANIDRIRRLSPNPPTSCGPGRR